MHETLELLLALTRAELDEQQLAGVRDTLAESGQRLDWGLLVDRAARHRVLPIVGRHILRHRLFHSETRVPAVPYAWVFESAYLGNKQRNDRLLAEAGRVIDALNATGLRYAIRKGPLITERLYRDTGLRRMSDLDVLVEREAAADLGRLLETLGYEQGRLSADGRHVRRFSRSTKLFWKLNVSNELPYTKPVELDYIDAFYVDVCLSIFQTRSNSTADMADLLDRRITVPTCGTTASALDPEDQFVDLCSHLHKEAITLHYIESGIDLQLLKFLDVALSCVQLTAEGRWQSVRDRASRYGVERSVHFAMHYTAILYPDLVPTYELAALRPADCGYLDEYGEFDGVPPQRWNVPFMDRLFDVNRHAVGMTSSIPRD